MQFKNEVMLNDTYTASATSSESDISKQIVHEVEAIYTVAAATTADMDSATDIDADADTFTKTAHGYVTGRKGQMSTSSALPTGLATSTDYYVIKVDADTFKLASSYANAVAGAAIDITDTGDGTQTFTPTALSGCSVKLQSTMDGTNWTDVSGASQTITATGSCRWPKADCAWQGIRAVFAITAGQVALSVRVNAK